MVRLKDAAWHMVRVSVYISIPYGAIKSWNEFRALIGNFTFQFLMVRLKVTCQYNINCDVALFQFLMVRLKEKF